MKSRGLCLLPARVPPSPLFPPRSRLLSTKEKDIPRVQHTGPRIRENRDRAVKPPPLDKVPQRLYSIKLVYLHSLRGQW